MELKRESRFRYSEDDMAQAFQRLLLSENGLPGVGVFNAIYREISCRQGRPDFIALRFISPPETRKHISVNGLVCPAILQNLKPRAPRTLDYLVTKLEFGRESVRKSLRQLIENGYIEQLESGAYRLSSTSDFQTPEIWTFELKLNNSKKAVFQAQQSRTYAERAIIVVPPGQEKNYKRFEVTMQRWHIGLATFDPLTGVFRFVRKGRKSRALSRTQQLYTLSRLSPGHRAV
jgi:biotin operon repressor